MHIRFSVRDPDGFSRDVAVDAAAGAALDDVCADIASLLPRPGDGELWSGSRRLPPTALLGGPGLRDGDVVHVGRAGERDLAAGAVLRLHVVGGPDAGVISPLPRGMVCIGRDPACDLTLTDPDVSRQHAAITVTTSGITVRDLGSTNGTFLDGVPVDPDASPVQPGQLLRLGESLICIAGADEPAAAVRAGADGVQLVNRPPRLSAQLPEHEVLAPTRPSPSGPQRVQWLAALLPAAAGVALAVTMHSVQFLAFALLSPVVIIATAAGDRLHWRRERRREAGGFRKREAAAQRECTELLAEEVRHRRRAHPDPAAVVRTATIPDCRLWERRRCDPDALQVRLGLADVPSSVRVRRATHSEPVGVAPLVPSTVDLRRGPLGVCGPRGIVLGTGRWAVAQLAALHSPADLRLVCLLCDAASTAWTWARWLPQLHAAAITSEERAATAAELGRLVDDRLASRQLDPNGWSGPWTVLVVDRAGALADTPGLARVLAAGPAVGVSAICLDDDERRLPTSCAAVARVCGETGTRLTVETAAATHANVINDRVSTRWAERVARALAPLADASADTTTAIPHECRLLDLLGLDDPSPDAVLARWRAARRPSTPLGVSAEGVFEIDLERDGPHTLVAGTTGAGKSELLQSLIAGLAASNGPDAIAFILIDYKGGAAFADCARLPHSVGMVTDLDAHLTSRALQSLDAELRRRETLFAAAGTKDLAAYRASAHHRSDPLGRLVLVVDEFAALADELPDFVTGLVAIAQRGRSLGVHLVLATQRPGGVISPEIRANTTLRIALRVTDPAESRDVIGSDVSARIDKLLPGRAYVRTGPALTEIQTGRVGCAAAGGRTQATVTALDQWGRRPRGEVPDTADKTDLHVLVDAVCEAAARAGTAPPARPWLAPLPGMLAAAALDGPQPPSMIPIGLRDLPDEQRQRPLCIDLRAGGPTLFVGGARSGRSTVLRASAVGAASRLGPDDLHVYVLDCAGGGLHRLRELPHCGAVATRDDFGVAERVLARLGAEVARRNAVLAGLGVSSVAEARDHGEALPYIALLIDGWEGFVTAADEHDAGQSVDTLLTLVRESAAAGITVAITGDRSALAARVASGIARKYLLRLSDSADYALAGVPARAVPDAMPPGRAISADDGTEVQFAFLGRDPALAEQHARLAEVALAAPRPVPGTAPFQIRSLPARVSLDSLPAPPDRATVLGVGGDAADAVAVDLFAGDGRLIVAGPPRSGRTTVLRVILEQVLRAPVDVRVAAPGRSALAVAALAHGVEVIDPVDPAAAVGPVGERPVLLLVDDSEAFLDTAAGDVLTGLVKPGPAPVAAVVAARSDELAVTYRGVASEVRRSRTGLLLQPGPADGDLLGLRLPRSRAIRLPGRGLLVLDDAQLVAGGGTGVVPIQVALPSS